MNNLEKNQHTKNKAVVVSLTDPSDVARTLHAFEYALDLKRNGIESQIVLDGAGVKIVENEPHELIKPLYNEAIERGVLKEACNFCANIFGVKISFRMQISELVQAQDM
jgi:predicted peroxiredoxin